MNNRAFLVGLVWFVSLVPMFFMGMFGDWIEYYVGIIQLLAAFLTVYFCFDTSRALDSDDPNKIVWNYISLGSLSWGIGLLIHIITLESGLRAPVPFPWFSDVFCLMFTVFAAFGLFLFWKKLEIKIPKWGWIVAGIFFVCAVVWSIFVANKGFTANTTNLAFIATYVFIITDAILLSFAIMLASALIGGMLGNQLWILIFGFVVYYAGEQLYISAVNAGIHGNIGLVDISWPVALGLISISAILTKTALQKSFN